MAGAVTSAATAPVRESEAPALVRRRLIPAAGPHLFVCASVALLVVAIHVSYEYLIAPNYSYMQLTYSPVVPFVYATMVALILAMSLIMPVRITRASDVLAWGVFVLVVIPSLTITHLARTLPSVPQLTLGFTVTACFSAAVLLSRMPSERILARVRPLRPRAFWIVVIAISAVTYVSLAASGNLRVALPGFGEIYALRASFSAASIGTFLPYFMASQSGVINPMLMAIGLSARRPFVFAAGVVAQLLLYATAGHKSVLFAVPAVVIIAWVFRGHRRPPGALMAWGLAGVIALSAAVDEILHTPWLSSLFTRRFIDLPGLLTGAWIDVFSSRPKAHFGYSFLSMFLPYHYDAHPPFVVAEAFFHQPAMNANANLFADGYANFGWWGIAFESAILAAVLIFTRAASTRVPLMPAAMVVVMPIVALSNSSIVTSLLSHGLILMILVFVFAPASVWTRTSDDDRVKPVGAPGVAGGPPGAAGGPPAPARSAAGPAAGT